MFGLGTPELIIILIIALLLFGRRLPEVMRNLGSSVREFKKGMNEFGEVVNDDERPRNAPPPAKDAADAGEAADREDEGRSGQKQIG